jgi:hypothetical protein
MDAELVDWDYANEYFPYPPPRFDFIAVGTGCNFDPYSSYYACTYSEASTGGSNWYDFAEDWL